MTFPSIPAGVIQTRIAVLLFIPLALAGLSGCRTSPATTPSPDQTVLEQAALRAQQERASIEGVLQQYSQAVSGAQRATELVNQIQMIDTKECSADFRMGFIDHVNAWETMIDVEKDSDALAAESNSDATKVEAFFRGLFGDPFGKANEINADQTELERRYNNAREQIRSSYHELQKIAIQHGATISQ